MAQQIISKEKLLESGLQYGHQTRSWNPAMKPFIAMSRNRIHVINLDKTAASLNNAYNVAKRISEKGGTFLFVGTTKQSSKTVRENAERVGAFYIDHRWLGGTLTNFRTIQNSVNKLRNLERLEKTNFEGYTKKEGVQMRKELEKLEKTLGGIKFMRRTPSAIFVTSINNEDIAIKEAKKMGIPVFGIADTNTNPNDVNFPIFGNDDANKACALVTTVIADAIASAKGGQQLAAFVADEKLQIMGVEPRVEREGGNFQRNPKPRFERADRPARTERPARVEKTVEIKEETKVVEEKPATVKEEVVVEAKASTEDYSKLTVAALKELLDSKNVEYAATAKKADLVALAEKN